ARVPEAEIKARTRSLRRLMRGDRLQAVFLTTRPAVHYYSGFTGDDSALLLTLKKAILLTDFRYFEEAEGSTHGCEILLWKKSIPATAGKLARDLKVRSIGFEETDLSIKAYKLLRSAARGCKLVEWVGRSRMPRLCKSEFELKAISKALRVAEKAFMETRALLRPGMLEIELARELEYRMQTHGAEGTAFPSVVAVGANASLPHAHPGKRKILEGKPLLIDWGARLDNYNSDLTRTLFLGSIPSPWKERYQCVLEAQLFAISKFTANTTTEKVDLAAYNKLEESGLAKRFGHALGHGVGLEVHEGPVLSRRVKGKLKPGMVVTVEPGVYFPKRGGIRIEDMVLMTAKGARVLSRLPKSLDWASIS
ncbi:MAG: aminopeptidase P family protein, partial [Planctomycetes bacterium]|nr:aminopeptidase P family protein [Planctomycetota bacterium]